MRTSSPYFLLFIKPWLIFNVGGGVELSICLETACSALSTVAWYYKFDTFVVQFVHVVYGSCFCSSVVHYYDEYSTLILVMYR